MDDAALKSLLTADVPASDPRFVLGVMRRAEQRRYIRELAQTAGLAVCAAALLWLLAPLAEATWHENLAPYVNNLVVLLVLMSVTVALPYFLPSTLRD